MVLLWQLVRLVAIIQLVGLSLGIIFNAALL